MIRFSLSCSDGHAFEGWFASSHAFEAQRGERAIACPVCGDADVEKALMAPKPEGFNLWGYLLPGAAITAGPGRAILTIRRAAASFVTTTARCSGLSSRTLRALRVR